MAARMRLPLRPYGFNSSFISVGYLLFSGGRCPVCWFGVNRGSGHGMPGAHGGDRRRRRDQGLHRRVVDTIPDRAHTPSC